LGIELTQLNSITSEECFEIEDSSARSDLQQIREGDWGLTGDTRKITLKMVGAGNGQQQQQQQQQLDICGRTIWNLENDFSTYYYRSLSSNANRLLCF
jgi:hypothetical protein